MSTSANSNAELVARLRETCARPLAEVAAAAW